MKNKCFRKKKKNRDCPAFLLRLRIRGREDWNFSGVVLSPFVSSLLLSRITARSTRVRQVRKQPPSNQSYGISNPIPLESREYPRFLHPDSGPPLVSHSRPPIFRPHLPFCHSSVTAKSSVNKKGDTYVRTWGCYPMDLTKNVSLTRFARIGNTIGIVIRRVIASCTSTLQGEKLERSGYLEWMDLSLSLWVNNVLHLLSYFVLAFPYFELFTSIRTKSLQILFNNNNSNNERELIHFIAPDKNVANPPFNNNNNSNNERINIHLRFNYYSTFRQILHRFEVIFARYPLDLSLNYFYLSMVRPSSQEDCPYPTGRIGESSCDKKEGRRS